MKNDRRLRRLVTDRGTWYWSVRQRLRPAYEECSLALSLFPDPAGRGGRSGRRLSFVFRPTPDRIISHCYFESGTAIRLSDRNHLNLYEPGTVRRLLEAAAPVLDLRPGRKNVEVDGWTYFDKVVDDLGHGPTCTPGRRAVPSQ
ncbi:hypothetical protein ACIRTB_13450 [Streptomyces sp. NPDC101158]|uniref:hypothetical protein n=1 Tax=Streptomyces sp. NPDC101158 TaxID=3366117 RepID=UPI003817246C